MCGRLYVVGYDVMVFWGLMGGPQPRINNAGRDVRVYCLVSVRGRVVWGKGRVFTAWPVCVTMCIKGT